MFRQNKKLLSKEAVPLSAYEFKDLDKIIQEKGLKYYLNFLYDEQVKFCLTIKKYLILSGGWEVIPISEDQDAIKQAEFIVKNFNLLERSFSSILFSILSALDFGFSISEIIFKEQDNYLVLKNIKTKFPWLFDFQYDDYGNLTKILVEGEEIPRDKFLIWSYSSYFGQVEGESDLKAIYRNWWLKDITLKFYARYLERYVTPIVKGQIPSNATEEEQQRFFEILKRIHNVSIITLPKSSSGESFDFELVETKKDAGEQFLKAIEISNEAIGRGLLIPALFGATKAAYGSYALGELQFDVVYQFLMSISNNLSDEVVNKQLIKLLIDLNFDIPKYPKFRIKPISREFLESYLKYLKVETNGT